MITQLICHFHLDMAKIDKQFGIRFEEYFARELDELRNMETDGLVSIDNRRITVNPAGHLLIRNVCMPFDKYLRATKEQRFSKVI